EVAVAALLIEIAGGLPSDGSSDCRIDVAWGETVARGASAIDIDLDGRLAERIQHPEIGNPRHRAHHLPDLGSGPFKRGEIVAEQLDRILALDTRRRLFDVVFDILREVELDTRKFGFERGIDFFRQLLLVDILRPGVEWPQRNVEFGVEKAGGIGTVVGTPIL